MLAQQHIAMRGRSPDRVRHLLDRDLRAALVAGAMASGGCDPAILHEVCLGEACRVDVVLASSTLHAYEIKSDADSLRRLPAQVAGISAAFPYATLLCTSRHVNRAEHLIPPWWGITIGTAAADGVSCVEHRPASANPTIDRHAASRLIWRTDALLLLERHHLDEGLWNAPRPVLWNRIADQLPVTEIVIGMRDSFFRRARRAFAEASS